MQKDQEDSSMAQYDEYHMSEILNRMENEILHKIGQTSKYKKKIQYFYYDDQQQQDESQFDNKMDYYTQFWRTFIINEILITQIKQVSHANKMLNQKIQDINISMDRYFDILNSRNKKKNRRLANEISKNFKCPYQNCYKIYGTEVSLNLHIKLKHNGGTKTEREALAKQYVNALDKKLPLPTLNINLPPGYLQQMRSQLQK